MIKIIVKSDYDNAFHLQKLFNAKQINHTISILASNEVEFALYVDEVDFSEKSRLENPSRQNPTRPTQPASKPGAARENDGLSITGYMKLIKEVSSEFEKELRKDPELNELTEDILTELAKAGFKVK